MPIPSLRKLRWPLVGAAAGVLAGGATALAGSGVGGVFNLGVDNVVSASTRLSGSTPSNPQLLVGNDAGAPAIKGESPNIGVKGSSTGGTGVNGSSNGGAGVVGLHASASGANPGVSGQTNSTDPNSAGVIGRNTAGGPGLSAIVSSQAVPPLKVSSTARVPFLNADYVDGRHANGLLRVAEATSKDFLPNVPTTLRTGAHLGSHERIRPLDRLGHGHCRERRLQSVPALDSVPRSIPDGRGQYLHTAGCLPRKRNG
jgi:hypothetical protein